MSTLNALFKKINSTIVAADASLSGRVTFGKASEKLDVSTSPYVVTSLLSNPSREESYQGTSSSDYACLDTLVVQVSVYGKGLAATEAVRESIEDAFHRQALVLETGTMLHAKQIQEGLIVEPKNKDSVSVYHAFSVFEFTIQK